MSGALRGRAPAWHSPYRVLSPGGSGARLSIFIFHRVLPQPDPLQPYEPSVAEFDWMVGFIARYFRVLPLAEAAQALARGKLPAAAAAITFDDGYADNHDLALPVLQRHGVTATFFIATGYIGGGRMWNDSVIETLRRQPDGELHWADLGLAPVQLGPDPASRGAAIKTWLHSLKYLPPAERDARTHEMARRAGLAPTSTLMMTRHQVRALAQAGMSVGGHTISHPILTTVDHATARDEIGGGRETLAEWLGESPRVFAYPDGIPVVDYTGRELALVRGAGFEAAVSTASGVARRGDDVLQLPRFTPWDRTVPRFGVRCALNLMRREAFARVGSPRSAA
jgi:peptidoglycan/xylan/chitin deacetylase (PgdA/CDA1 family)